MFTIENMEDGIFTVKVSGKLTHQDYRQHLIPALEKVIAANGEINLLIEAQDFHGWEWHAAFDDFETGIKYRKKFKRIAIVGDQDWERLLSKLFSFIIAGEVRYFSMEQFTHAKQWLSS